MKNMSPSDIQSQESDLDAMLPEYDFDYRKARPNRFAITAEEQARTVVLDPDIAQVFTSSQAVNQTLRALLTTFSTLPKTVTQHTG